MFSIILPVFLPNMLSFRYGKHLFLLWFLLQFGYINFFFCEQSLCAANTWGRSKSLWKVEWVDENLALQKYWTHLKGKEEIKFSVNPKCLFSQRLLTCFIKLLWLQFLMKIISYNRKSMRQRKISYGFQLKLLHPAATQIITTIWHITLYLYLALGQSSRHKMYAIIKADKV